jgi:hypothetical protein
MFVVFRIRVRGDTEREGGYHGVVYGGDGGSSPRRHGEEHLAALLRVRRTQGKKNNEKAYLKMAHHTEQATDGEAKHKTRDSLLRWFFSVTQPPYTLAIIDILAALAKQLAESR